MIFFTLSHYHGETSFAWADGQRSYIYIVDTLTGVHPIMRVEFLKWGNSLALRVPKAFALEIGAVHSREGYTQMTNLLE